MAPKKSDKAAKEAAAKLAARQEAAENAFSEADGDGSGSVDAKELEGLLIKLLMREQIQFERKFVAEFVAAEFSKADSDGSGDVDFDEFISYFNSLLDRLAGGAMNQALDEAKKVTNKKLEEQAIAEDDGVFAHLHTLAAILSAPSVRSYAGLVVPFKLQSRNAENAPNPEHGSTSHGLVLDFSRRAQRLLTPWGSLPIGYRLAFEGYQEKIAPVEDEASKKKASKKMAVPWPTVAAEPTNAETHPIIFTMAKPPPKPAPGEAAKPPPLMRVRKLPMRCHYQVTEILGQPLPLGEAVAVSDTAALKKLGERWQNMLKKYPKDPTAPLPAEDSDGGPLVNMLAGSTVAIRQDRLENLKRRKEVTSRTGNKKIPEEDLEVALLVNANDDAAAAKMVTRMQSSENTVLDRRAGHATRAMVRYALATCEFDADHAEWMLKNQEKLLKKLVDKIFEQRGLESGLGYPSRQALERMLVYKRADEGPVLAELKRQWRGDIEAMGEIIAAAEVEEMLTPEKCDAFAFSRPLTASEAQHVEDLYLSDEFDRNKDAVVKFLSEAGTVLKRSATLGAPSREEVEDLLRELSNDSERVLAFLQAWSNLIDIAPKQGQATREECKRYLQVCDRNEEQAMELMKTIWKLANPKAPKPPPKGSKKPPQEHYSQKCGFPSRDECEWALLGTRSDKEGKPLLIDKAVELLCRLDTIHQERKHPQCTRDDIVWALDVRRTEKFIKVRPLSHEEYKAGESPASVMCGAIAGLIEAGKTSGLQTGRAEILASLEKLSFDQSQTERWLNGVGTLMTRQNELGIVSREEVEAAMEYHELDDAKVIELFQETAELQRKKLELGNPSRDEIKAMLTLAWEVENRFVVTSNCIATYRELMSDEAQLMTLFGRTPVEEDKLYLRTSILNFLGEGAASKKYLHDVAEIQSKGDSLGHPTREEIIKRLAEFGGDKRKATQSIREEYHKRRNAEAKEEYMKNKAQADKAKAVAG